MTTYRLDVYDLDGVLRYQLTDKLWFSYTRRVNAPGLLQFGYWGGAELLETIGDKWQVEVWRNAGQWRREFVGFYRNLNWQQPDIEKAVLTCNGIMALLSWRTVAYPAGVANRTRFINQSAETIAKVLVTRNATTAGTVADGRLRDVPAGYPRSGTLVEVDSEGGNSLDWFCANRNLLNTLQELSDVGGGDFDVVKVSDTTWEFRWYDDQLGDDKTDDVTFAVELGNMANPFYSEAYQDEKTIAIVGGQGEADDREYVVREGENLRTDNDIEVFVDAKDVDSTEGLNARGDSRLEELQMREEFSFDVLQAPATRYGEDYDLGDIVTAINPFTGVDYTMKIKSVTVSMNSEGEETISAGMAVQ